MSRYLKFFAIIWFAVISAGCASSNSMPITFKEIEREKIRSVAIVSMPDLPGVRVAPSGTGAGAVMGVFGVLGGVVGSLIHSAIVEARVNTLSEPVWKSLKESDAARLSNHTSEVVEQLTTLGYETKVVDRGWIITNGVAELAPNVFDSGADATLILVPRNLAIFPLEFASNYKPTMAMNVRVHAGKENTTVYQALHATGAATGHKSIIHAGDTKDTFESYEMLVGTPDSVQDVVIRLTSLLVKSATALFDRSIPSVDFEAIGAKYETDFSSVEED